METSFRGGGGGIKGWTSESEKHPGREEADARARDAAAGVGEELDVLWDVVVASLLSPNCCLPPAPHRHSALG